MVPVADRRRGRLVLVVGPSGVGKDALIAYCRSRLAGQDGVVFARRTITRTAADGSEDCDCVSEAEFDDRVAAGAFAIDWRAHGLRYGVPATIEPTLAGGRTVVVNVSRSVVDALGRRYRPLVVVSVAAEAEIVAQRLRRRGRETAHDIDRRLARASDPVAGGSDVVRLDNSGPIEEAGEVLLRLLAGGRD